jgi:hypothetical protein
MANRFYVNLQCKPYVKRFLEINFGNPADFTSDYTLKCMVRQSLKKPVTKDDKKYGSLSTRYTETLQIQISEDDFYRYGWELTKSDTVAFGREIEDRVKFMMRTLVAVNFSLNGSIKTSIFGFQKRFSFGEDIWPYDSIKKEFYRNGAHDLINFNDEIFNKIENIILENLSKKGTISQQAIKQYEINQQAER